MPRIYQPIPLTVQTEIQLDSWGKQHVKALRLQKDDEIIIFNGQGNDYCGKITCLSSKKINVQLLFEKSTTKEPSLTIHLIQSISRGERMDYTVQKATELGVASIFPVISERCEVRLSEERFQKRQQHWQQIVISACEQTGRTRIPLVHSPQPLLDSLKKSHGLTLVLDPDENKTLDDLDAYPIRKLACIFALIGPEGGFAPLELQQIKEKGFQGLRLGPRILRTETAGPALLAALHARWGDFLL